MRRAWGASRSTRCCRCSPASGSTGAGATLRVERPAAFDDRFSEVWETTWRQGTVTSERNPELLNWKYEMAREGGIYRILALVGTDEQVAGYAVYTVRNDIRHVVDIVFQQSQEVLDALLAELIRDARKRAARWRSA